MDEEVRVAILEQKQEVLEHFVEKLDSAIEKIAEVNTNVSRMLAVHEEKLSKQDEIDGILFAKIDELRDKMDSDHVVLRQRLSLLERRLWTTVGALGAVVLLSNPQAIKLIRPLFSSANSAIIAPVVAIVDGSS
jgi:vacuolar-type H+-ATPase subunit E/Vma4|tara:strand:- start:1593 stop:1994 length:402 start_codon:yes stop_codon:yes gene_type:complete